MVTQVQSHVFLLFIGLMSRITNEEERYASTHNSIFIITTSVLNYTNLMCNALSITYQKGNSRGRTDEVETQVAT